MFHVFHVEHASDILSGNNPLGEDTMNKPTTSQREGNVDCNDSISSTEPFSASTDSAADLVASEISATVPVINVPKAGCRARRPQSATRQVRAIVPGETIAQVVRSAAADRSQFEKVCARLMVRARFKFPHLFGELEDLLQEAVTEALSSEHPAGDREVGAFIWIRFVSRVYDLVNQRKRQAVKRQRHAAAFAAACGFREAGLNTAHRATDSAMVDMLDRVHRARRAFRKMSGRERLAFNLWLEGNAAADSGLHRHSLRHALAKVEAAARE